MADIRIHLVRHGEVFNPDGILYGRLPGFGLSDRGREMARRVAAELPERSPAIRALVASPLQRTHETITPLAERLGLDFTVDERVIEAENDFEGKHVSKETLLGDWDMMRRLYNPLRPSWGEPYRDQALRVRAAMFSLRARLQAIAAAEGRDEIAGVIVAHQLPIWATRLFTEGRSLVHDPRQRECALASVTTFSDGAGVLTETHYDDLCADLQPAKAVTGA